MSLKSVMLAMLAIAAAMVLNWFARDLTIGYRILIGLVQGALMLTAIFALVTSGQNSSRK